MSSTSVDFPLPLGPVTHVKHPSGNATVTSRKLFSRAPFTVNHPSTPSPSNKLP